MLTDKTTADMQTPAVSPGNYSPVTITVNDSVGAIFLGLLALIMLIGWRRAEARYRTLLTQQKSEVPSTLPDHL